MAYMSARHWALWVSEELLVAGAPIRAHWLATPVRPLLLAYGTENKAQIPSELPLANVFCVGMSGQDSSSISPPSVPAPGCTAAGVEGERWTGFISAHMMTLFAHCAALERRHGVSASSIDLKSTPISADRSSLAGGHDFNEVVFR
jgi:hypothetical protein